MRNTIYILICLVIPLSAPSLSTIQQEQTELGDFGEFVSIIDSPAEDMGLDIDFALFRKPIVNYKTRITHKYYFYVVGVSNLTSNGSPVYVDINGFELEVVDPSTNTITYIPSEYQNPINITVLDYLTTLYTFGGNSDDLYVNISWSKLQYRIDGGY